MLKEIAGMIEAHPYGAMFVAFWIGRMHARMMAVHRLKAGAEASAERWAGKLEHRPTYVEALSAAHEHSVTVGVHDFFFHRSTQRAFVCYSESYELWSAVRRRYQDL